MGREESVAQAKAAQKEKEIAAHAKKEARKDAQWAVGSKDTSKEDADASKLEAKKAAEAEKKAQEVSEGGAAASSGGGGGVVMKKCKDCGQKYNTNSKKGCQNCIDLLFGGGVSGKAKGKSRK